MEGVREGEKRVRKRTEEQEPKAILLHCASSLPYTFTFQGITFSLTNDDDGTVGMLKLTKLNLSIAAH